MKPIVSVITPYRNAKKFLPGFVDSLQRQTAEDWTCILAELVADDPHFQVIINATPKH